MVAAALAVIALVAVGLPRLLPREVDDLVLASPRGEIDGCRAMDLPVVAERIEVGSESAQATPAVVAPAAAQDRADPNSFRVRLLDTCGRPRAGVRLRAHVLGHVWHGDATCDALGIATFRPARGLMVRVAPLDAGDEDWQVELGSSTHAVIELRFDPQAAAGDLPR